MDILHLLEHFPEAVQTAAQSLSSHHVSYYLRDLAGSLHRYYTLHPVLTAEEPERVQARLHLLLAVAQTLRNGLALLGVSAPEQM